MKITRKNVGVAEVLSSVLLLAIAVSVFSVIYVQVLSDEGPVPGTDVTLIGKVEPEGDLHNTVAFENQRGEKLDPETKIILTIAGQERSPKTISDLAFIYPFLQDGWDIGEKLYPIMDLGDLSDVRIDATIVDKNSNSIVFWGRLQEGYVAPPLGRGGIWHFDEDIWNGTPKEVKDSSENNNHGTAYNGARIVNITVDSSEFDLDKIVHNNLGYFDGLDDYVEVKSTYSLNITDEITIEAWINPLQLDIVRADQNYGAAFAYDPEITQISDGVYAVVSGWGKKTHQGLIYTIKIFPDGTVEDITGDNSFSYDDWAYKSDMTHIAGDYYGIVFCSKNESLAPGELKIVNISEDGQISQIVYDFYEFDADVATPEITKISNNTFAIVYTANEAEGIIKTINVTADGLINGEIDTFMFDSVQGYEPNILKISAEIYAIVYRGSGDHGILKTFNITSDGIVNKEINSFEFDSYKGYKPTIICINNSIYGIAYHQKGDAGILKTINITSDGQIIDNIYNSTLVFSSDNDCYKPRIIEASKGVYAIIYPTGEKQGISKCYLITVEIAYNGSISNHIETIANGLGDKPNKCFEPDIIQISPRIFAVVYRESDPHDGKITTIIIGEDPTPKYRRGVVRAGAAGIYAEYNEDIGMVNLLACINTSADDGVIITAQITPGWHHITLTFDGSIMRLYNDSYFLYSKSVNDNIYLPKTNLRFGNIFHGYIDEIAIFDHVIPLSEIQAHADPNIGIWEFY